MYIYINFFLNGTKNMLLKAQQNNNLEIIIGQYLGLEANKYAQI